MIQTKTQQLNPQIFTIWSDEIEGRIDPYFYKSSKYNFKGVALSNFVEKISSGNYISRDKFITNGKPYLRVQNLKENKIETGKLFLDDNEGVVETDYKTFLTGRVGSLGNFVMARGKYFYSDNILSIKFKENEKINLDYLEIILNSPLLKEQIERNCKGNNQKLISQETIKNLKIPLPSLQIQNKIVSIMSKAYEEKKEKEKEAEKLLESIDDYVLSELGIKIPLVKKEIVFEIWSNEVENKRIDAEYWQPFLEKIEQGINNGKYKAKKLKDFITKIHYGVSTSNAYVDDGIPLLRILNLKENYIDLSKVVKLPETKRKEIGNAFVKKGDLLISRSGTVGIVSVVSKEADEFAFGSFMIKFCLNDKIDKNFVSIWLNNKINKLITEREKIGAIQGNITISVIENFNIPIPSIAIQNKIVKKVNSIYKESQILQKEAKENLQKAKRKVEKMILG
jgi:restriction endonuclease S subunit